MSVILFIGWLIMNNSLQPGIVISGAILSVGISMIFCRYCRLINDVRLTPKALAYSFAYIFVFSWALIKANLDVASRVIRPSLPIKPGIVQVRTKLKSKIGRLILANSVTLTPGTLIVEYHDDLMFIHWIDVKSEDVEKASQEIIGQFEKYLEVMYG